MASAGLVLLLASSLLGAQDAKARYAEAQAKLGEHLWKERLELGDWAKSKGLFADAASHYRFVAEGITQPHPWRTRASKALQGTWKKKADTADAKTREEHAKRVEAYVTRAGELSFIMYLRARDGGLDDLAASTLAKTLEFDPDQKDARAARGEERVEGFGWIPSNELDRWKDVKRSEHFILRAEAGAGPAAEEALQRLEEVRSIVLEVFGDRFQSPGPIALYWTTDPMAYSIVRARVPGAPPDAPSFYSHLTHVAYAFGAIEVLVHETVHAIIDHAAGPGRSLLTNVGRRSDAERDVWVIEGLACAFADARRTDQGIDYRGPALPEGFDRTEFSKLDFKGFQKDRDRNYINAHALTRELLLGPKRGAFLDFARDFYAGRGDSSALWK